MPLHRRKAADLWILELDGQPAVVKDFSKRTWLYRKWIGPWLVDREARALESLAGIDGVPRLIQRLDSLALVMEYVEGTPCSHLEPGELEPEFFPRLERLLEEIHARGWVHADLRTAANVIRRPDGRPCLLDFAVAFSREGSLGPLRRSFFDVLVIADRTGMIRLKEQLAPELITDEEKGIMRHPPWPMRVAHFYRQVYHWLRGRRKGMTDDK